MATKSDLKLCGSVEVREKNGVSASWVLDHQKMISTSSGVCEPIRSTQQVFNRTQKRFCIIQMIEKTNHNAHQSKQTTTLNSYQAQEANSSNIDQWTKIAADDISHVDKAADRTASAHAGNEEPEIQKRVEKKKPIKGPSAKTSQPSKRARSEVIYRQQFESPFHIPLTTTQQIKTIENHEIKRSLNYMTNRTSAVLKHDGTQNKISVEAHLVQERGQVFTSRCNSCGNQGRPAGECVALKGFLQGTAMSMAKANVAHYGVGLTSKSSSKRQTGGFEEVLIQQFMAMDSDDREDLEDRVKDILNAFRKARS
ncbi:hypothetical protein NHQ30_011304 [Ciborinia camelliae]|nr:hypothetical protein NHQ30_011304 [Ciborinia camelliae]